MSVGMSRGGEVPAAVSGPIPSEADAVICGAGIAGASCAYQLARVRGLRPVVVEAATPLGLTSDKSTECYRNWWPGPGDAVVRFMNRSIDLLEAFSAASGDRFQLNRRGYLFATAVPETGRELAAAAEAGSGLGVGPLRRHPGSGVAYEPHRPHGIAGGLDGVDLITDQDLIRRHFPYLSPETVAVLHVRRCGWLSAQQLGAWWLEEAREAGAVMVRGRVVAIEEARGRRRVVVDADGRRVGVETPVFVNAAGPHAREVGRLAGVELPLVCERHVKVSFEDTLEALARDAPLVIWSDPVELPWSAEERALLSADPDGLHLLRTFPAGAHGRPVGGLDGRSVLLYWTYEAHLGEPVFPLTWDPRYPEIVLRGMSRMLPGLEGYFERLPRPFVDGGYYTKTVENRPLIGPTPAPGIHVCVGLSGFGIMAAAAAGELLAAHVAGGPLPEYAGAFLLSRYDDPEYRALLADWPDTGQL